MINSILVGSEVIYLDKEVGRITSFDGSHFVVEFNDRKATFVEASLIGGFLKYTDKNNQDILENEIAKLKEDELKKDELKRIVQEKRAEEIAAKKVEEETKKTKTSKKAPSHPFVEEKRNSTKPVVFMVCQNDNFEVESRDGYIWAPDHKLRGDTDYASHRELEFVKKGDIIIHHFANKIYAISVAKKDCERKAATFDHPNYGEIGRYVELDYHLLDNIPDTSKFAEIKRTLGSMKYGPFTKEGKNKQGYYLSELSTELAITFLDEAIVVNPSDSYLIEIKNKI